MSSNFRVQFRAVHTLNAWRKAKHYNMWNALRGPRGAVALFAEKGSSYAKYGKPLYVIAWETGETTGFVVKSDGNGGLLQRSISIDFDDSVSVAREVLDQLFFDPLDDPGFWWVNHKQTSRVELAEGYIWSPREKKGGVRNQAYINLTLVRPGDIVISYAETLIKAIGVARDRYVDAPKPTEYGSTGEAWNQIGWKVPVAWVYLDCSGQPIPDSGLSFSSATAGGSPSLN